MNQLKHFREQVDEFMARHPQSPLSPAQQADFEGLAYYDHNPDLAFEVTVERLPDSEPMIEMQTNTGDIRPFRRYGRFTFTVAGEEASLTIYSDRAGQDFFMPFKDATNGQETYGAGRYLDNHRPGLEQIDDDRFYVDFNYAYNPYCAYSPDYSCPLPPRENWLQVPVRAGEKDYKKS